MNIALDAMGGDHAPETVVEGALQALSHMEGTISLVGDPVRINALLPKPAPQRLSIVPASQVIEMDEKPTEALRKKKDSSLMVAVGMVKAGSADAVVSAGNTGAAAAAAQLAWRQMSKIHRPAIASLFPNKHGNFILLDAGASPDVDPEHLVEFAVMGRAYAEVMLKRTNPRVHLLNIGEEEGKGNAFVKRAYTMLSKQSWFAGNIEGKDLFREPCDVVVCDAFVGNVVLKTSEGVAEFIMGSIREALPESALARLPYYPMRKLMAPLRRRLDYAEYGAMPLLGLNGLMFIGHGRSNAKAIRNALIFAERAVKHGLLDRIRAEISE